MATVGGVLLLIGLADVVSGGSAAAASGGANFVATGHDMDYHCSVNDPAESVPECAYFKILVNKVRNGSTKPILALDQGSELTQSLTNVGLGPVKSVDPGDKAALDAVALNSSSGAPNFSALIVASDETCGGCDNNIAGETNINARSADIKKFFNAGGGILALAGADDLATYYNFVPLTGLNPVVVNPPFTVTSDGTALGITDTMANCCATHNSFLIPKPPFVTLEKDSKGFAETIAAFNVSIGGGGFTSPPPTPTTAPTATDQSVTTFVNTAKTVTLTGTEPGGHKLTWKIVHKPFHGTVTLSGRTAVYRPFTGFLGRDYFTFTVSDGTATSTQHVVNILVIPQGTTAPPLASTGAFHESHLTTGIVLLASGLLLLFLGVVRAPRSRRQH